MDRALAGNIFTMDPLLSDANEVAVRIFGADFKRKLAENDPTPHRLVGTVRSVNAEANTYIFTSIDGEDFEISGFEGQPPPTPGEILEVVCGLDEGLCEYVRIPLSEKFDMQTYGRFLEFAAKKPEFFYPDGKV